jgi:hypothetical protein
MNFKDLYNSAQSAADEQGDTYEKWDPPAGLALKVKVIRANGDDRGTKAGYPKFGFWLEVTEGEHQGKRFWDNVYFSSHDGANKRSFAKLAGAGFDDAWWSGGPSSEATAEAAVDREFVVHTAYQALKEGQTKPFPEHKWEAAPAQTFSVPGSQPW